ncbi:MAG TPA: cytochrome c [Gemmatimonadaceae bacterium]
MRLGRWSSLGWTLIIAGCAAGAVATNVRVPLGARLLPGAKTGVPVPLRRDPTARVILSSAAGLPPASFLPSQAARGEKVYGETCAMCHQASQHVGQAFVDNWNDRRVYDFYALVRATMPLDNPGGLKDQQYLDVIAYLLQANHQASPHADSLSADTVALRGHKIAVHYP